MGTSTDGIAIYGYVFPDGTQYSEKLSKIQDKQGFKAEISVGTHCSGDYPMYYLAAWELTAYRGSPKRLKIPTQQQRTEMDAKLRAFLEQHNIKIKRKPRLWLLSYWG